MIKHLITATSFALGGAGVIVVAHLINNPGAFTHPAAERPPVAVSHAAATPAAVEVTRDALVLSEVRITATRKRAQRQHVLPARIGPCTDWNDVGAMYIDPAGATGVRRVRNLCDPTRREER